MLSRSTWACELKSEFTSADRTTNGHAPRERVSWNDKIHILWYNLYVTLHVSVWVEIRITFPTRYPTSQSRSTWACELKCTVISSHWNWYSHAPRERVSWNTAGNWRWDCWPCHAPRERVSWNSILPKFQQLCLVTLHVSVWVEMTRSLWNVSDWRVTLHVSVWVEILCQMIYLKHELVTLHVSVWVEISSLTPAVWVFQSRSTWACELKFSPAIRTVSSLRHAPRERVSWNVLPCVCNYFLTRHAPRERVSWNEILFRLRSIKNQVTLHVSVWVEMLPLAVVTSIFEVTLHVSVWVEM